MPKLTLGVVQCALSDDINANIAKVGSLVEQAAAKGANVVLTPELFQGHYFCTSQEEKKFACAFPAAEHPCVTAFQKLAAKHGIFLPVSIFERDNHRYYNSVVALGPDGAIMGIYRKTHIPDGPGYQEKFYFRPGDTGYKVWQTPWGKIGVGICWDQWYPETARGMMLLGADILLYPTAIGSEPHNAALDTRDRWRRAQQGHAASNVVPVAASNRVGTENGQAYYGSSFITDQSGALVESLERTEEGILLHTFDTAAIASERAAWGFFRDMR
ncbi:MAG: N-carbamoylputrescine amidase [Micavibrio sp.]|nr:N-carbamoylputrescine amidase [Micavibrio sp.]